MANENTIEVSQNNESLGTSQKLETSPGFEKLSENEKQLVLSVMGASLEVQQLIIEAITDVRGKNVLKPIINKNFTSVELRESSKEKVLDEIKESGKSPQKRETKSRQIKAETLSDSVINNIIELVTRKASQEELERIKKRDFSLQIKNSKGRIEQLIRFPKTAKPLYLPLSFEVEKYMRQTPK